MNNSKYKNILKVNDINPFAYREVKFNYSASDYKKSNIEDAIKINDQVCSFFGCNKILTRADKLCGDRCPDHPKKESIQFFNGKL